MFKFSEAKSGITVLYADSSHNNRENSRSQLGYIICLADDSNKCSILFYLSHKSHRVARSSAAEETIAFVDTFDNTFVIRHDLQRMLGVNIPILMLTDSIQLFDVMNRSRYTTKRTLMVDISAVREACLQAKSLIHG